MPPTTRRATLQNILCAAAAFPLRCLLRPPSTPGAAEVTAPERAAMAELAQAFMRDFGAPALSVSIVRNGHAVFEGPFGEVTERGAPLGAGNLFRIASVTKPITSVAIFSLVEKSKLSLSDKVFGTNGILGVAYGPYPRYVTDITVDHLLTHTCGGWTNDSTDPMFRFPQMSHAELISWTVGNLPLVNPPGENYAYSNFGYCLLGRVIEKMSGQPYADYVRREILAPCGITDMRIAGNTLKQRLENEVTYLGQDENPYNMNVTRMDSHGGWLATPTDLARFADRATGAGVLKRETIARMLTPGPASRPSADVKYARGWLVRNEGRGNIWHNGSLPGTTSIMVHTASGFSWAALCNTRTRSGDINSALDNLVWQMARKVHAWTSVL